MQKMLAATTHIGATNSETTMEQYIFKTKQDGINIINLKKTWEKLVLAARAIAAIDNPADVFVVSCRQTAQRAVLKTARYIGATPIAGRFTPGAFTNQIQAAFREPRLLIIADPRADHQPVTESSYANIPIIGFCNVDSPTKFIDIAIPCNNKSTASIGLMWWFLAREVLRLRGTISREIEWDVMPDLFFFRDQEKEMMDAEQARKALEATKAEAAIVGAPPKEDDWAGEAAGANDWANEPTPAGGMPAAAAPAPAAAAPARVDEWAAAPSDWAAESAAPMGAPQAAQQWGGASGQWN